LFPGKSDEISARRRRPQRDMPGQSWSFLPDRSLSPAMNSDCTGGTHQHNDPQDELCVIEAREVVIVLGAQIRAGRALLDWSRKELASRARLHSNSVAYWEGTERICGRQSACERMEAALRAEGVVFFTKPYPGAYLCVEQPISGHSSGSPAHGVLHSRQKGAGKTKSRVPAGMKMDMSLSSCGAMTRKGAPCANKPMANLRCRLHGGLSRGPKTVAGRRRIAEAQRNRWERWRLSNRPPPGCQ
jgi:hypothetical protein